MTPRERLVILLLSPIFTEIRGEMVPEPATVSLGLLGLAALMMRRRRA